MPSIARSASSLLRQTVASIVPSWFKNPDQPQRHYGHDDEGRKAERLPRLAGPWRNRHSRPWPGSKRSGSTSGNVFADLGLPNAEEHQLKAQLVGSIHDVLRSRKLTQSAAAELLGLSQPDVSRLLRG